MRNRRAMLAALAAILAGLAVAGGQESGNPAQPATGLPAGFLWGALIRATDQPLKDDAKVLDEGLAEHLGQSFSFRNFQLLGEHTQPVSAEYETWVLPSEELYMKVDSKGPVSGGLGLHLQLWRRQNVILKTDVVLNSGSPIFIAGPKWGEDQLLFVVQLRDQAAE